MTAPLALSQNVVNLVYVVAAIGLILGIKGLAHPATARRRNILAAGGIALAQNHRSRDAVDAAVAQAVAAGATLLKAPEATDWGGYSGYVADPDGHPWEIAHNPSWPLADDGSLTLPG